MEQLLVKQEQRTENYYKESMKTLVGAKEWAKFFLDSKMCPKHFYETKIDEKGRKVPDYTKGNVGALLMVLQHGDDVDMKPSQAIQQIIPINGLMSIKGDGGKALILRSGKLKPGSWVERVEGTIQAKTYKVTITATRLDNGETLSRSFSVADAMRAGLWITEAQLKGKDGWRYKLSPWYRYPERMVKYRALGFLERDLFPDVLSGMITSEEAQDSPPESEIVTITTSDGKKIQITPQLQERSDQVTDDTVKKIDKEKAEADKKITPISDQGKISEDEIEKKYTDEELLTLGPKIYPLAESFTYKEDKLNFWIEQIPGKKSNKKYRLAIMAFQDGIFDKYLEREIGEETIKELGKEVLTPSEKPGEKEKVNTDDIDETLDQIPGQVKKDAEEKPTREKSQETEEFDKQFDKGGATEKDQRSEPAPEPNDTNKQDIEVPDLPEDGERPFDQVKFLYDSLNTLAVNDSVWVARTKGHPFGQLYKNKEDFCRRAGKNEINELLNSL